MPHIPTAFKAHISQCEQKLLILGGNGVPAVLKKKKKTRRHMIKYKKNATKSPPNSSQECIFDVLKRPIFEQYINSGGTLLSATLAW